VYALSRAQQKAGPFRNGPAFGEGASLNTFSLLPASFEKSFAYFSSEKYGGFWGRSFFEYAFSFPCPFKKSFAYFSSEK